MNKDKLLYLAGFFDGEGSINIIKRNRPHPKNPEFNLAVAIGQKDGATLDWITDNFGGNVYLVKRDGSFFWAIGNRKAYNFLKIIYPYLQYKKPQAEVAFALFDGRAKRKSGFTPTSELDRRERIRGELRLLHKTIIKSQYAGSESKRIDPKGM